MNQSVAPPDAMRRTGAGLTDWLIVLLLVYALLLGVAVIGDGFKWISGGAEGAQRIFAFASNPVVGVLLGILATALVQSSSTVTSVIVGLVAGGVPVATAVPMIMGANMGTTITNTIVSMGSISQASTFNKSFQAATVHDFFNLYSIAIFLPIEMLFHPLEKLGGTMAIWLEGDSSASMSNFNLIGALTKPVGSQLITLLQPLPTSMGAPLAIALGVGLVIGSVLLLGKLLSAVMTGRARGMIDRAVGAGPLKGIFSGTVITVLVQSSSTTTSLVVPLAGAGMLTTRQVYPFTMGANIGTCITALLAATAITGPNEVFALQIALVHLLYNVFGVLVFLYTPWLKSLPVRSAEWLGVRAAENRFWAFGYIFSVFFVLPGTVFGAEALFGEPEETMLETEVRDAVRESDLSIE